MGDALPPAQPGQREGVSAPPVSFNPSLVTSAAVASLLDASPGLSMPPRASTRLPSLSTLGAPSSLGALGTSGLGGVSGRAGANVHERLANAHLRLAGRAPQQLPPLRAPSAPPQPPQALPPAPPSAANTRHMRAVREVVRGHVEEHAAVLEWRREVSAQHARAAQEDEDEALTRYLRNAGLLRELFSEEARPLGALLDASSGEAAVAVARARLEELQRAPLVTDDNLLQIAAAMAATQQRYLTMGTFMRSAETSRSLRELVHHVDVLERATGWSVQLPREVKRARREARGEATGAEEEDAARRGPSPVVDGVLQGRRISEEQLQEMLAQSPGLTAVRLG